MVTVTVACDDPTDDGWACRVTLSEGERTVSSHAIRVRKTDLERLAPGASDPSALVEESFAFLLEREPPQSILRSFDVLGVVGSTRADGPTVGWSGHPHLRGWITHHSPAEARWQVDLLDHRAVAAGISVLDGVFLAARRDVLRGVPFDAEVFDGFHVGDVDWSLRAARAGFRLGVAADLGLVHASRGNYDATWERYAERFSVKHSLGAKPPAPSFFFGAKLDSADEVRAFFDLLRGLAPA